MKVDFKVMENEVLYAKEYVKWVYSADNTISMKKTDIKMVALCFG